MYCTCAPCGDASMELCMAAQEDPTPWEANPDNPDESKLSLLDGRAHFSRLGIVRRKPARADAESTLSKSCSDKLALRQISSLLSYETSLLVAPTETAYLAGVILPENEVSSVGCARAFSDKGRMKVLKGRFWPLHNNSHSSPIPDQESSGYRFRPFRVLSIPMQKYASLWRYAKTGSSGTDAQEKRKPAVISAVWTVAPSGPPPSVVENGVKSLPVLRRSKTGLYETLINGVKQGNRVSTPLARGASALSRAKLWDTWREIVRLSCSGTDGEGNGLQGRHPAALSIPEPVVDAASYREFKKILPVVAQGMVAQGVVARKRAIQEAKDVLDGWISNARDEDWGLEVLVDPKKRKR
ncbi:hypothetical protein EYZ11_003510 [Aspergillus tanneri]|nr:hypothetical protein EYZ11_003510 [Aspergillus tanneri]